MMISRSVFFLSLVSCLSVPCPLIANADEQRNVYFGDLHVHTRYSLDALTFGTFSGPEDAYRFAMGEPMRMPGGNRYQLDRPLDFISLTEHAFGLGEYALCVTDTDGPAWQERACANLRGGSGPEGIMPFLRGRTAQPPQRNVAVCGQDGARCVDAAVGPWQELQRAAEAFNRPGEFTTFIGFEWTPADRFRRTVHRNVIFANNTVPNSVTSTFQDPLVQEFWEWLDLACQHPCDAVVIPHNSNFSGGLMFELTNELGEAFTAVDWERRARFERLVEVFQIKGSSECVVGFGSSDEECGFEQFVPLCEPNERGRCASPPGFAREGLKIGLTLENQLNANPMAFGFIGSTDTHTSAAGAVNERRYPGHHSGLDASPEDALSSAISGGQEIYTFTPGGLAAVWAKENTREALFSSLKRRETYATSGTRLRLRFDANGMPMGSTIDERPVFSVRAERDVMSAPLHKLQIIKGWLDEKGTTHEKVIDVACSEGEPDSVTLKCPPQPSDLDINSCDPPEAGKAVLSVQWEDPEFDPEQPSFYYARVLEAPTCRWTTVLAKQAGLPTPNDVPVTIQERAWSSPIWYQTSAED